MTTDLTTATNRSLTPITVAVSQARTNNSDPSARDVHGQARFLRQLWVLRAPRSTTQSELFQRTCNDVRVEIRAAAGDDLLRVIAIDDIARRPDGSRGRLLEARLAERQMLVAEQDEEIVGYAIQDCSFFECGFVHLLYVSDQHRRQGIGAALLAASVTACATSRVFTSTNVSNDRMQRLLSKLGWVRAGLVDGLDTGDPEVFYYVDAS